MRQTSLSILALAAGATALQAGGIDRSGQPIDFIFEEGRKLEFALGYVAPDVSGDDLAVFGGGPSGDVAADYLQASLSFRTDVTERLAFGVILDEPYGADIAYEDTSVALGGTEAEAETVALTLIGRYRLSDNVSVHAGLRSQRASAAIHLQGAAYGAVSGYDVDLDEDVAYGYLVGASYEVPDIALRVSLTFASKITHEFETTETGPLITTPFGDLPLLEGSSETEVNTPASVNLDFQTGISADTLLFGQIRWAEYSDFRLDPERFVEVTGDGLIDLDDAWTYSLGVGRRFTDRFSGAVSVVYEPEDDDDLVSPLAPTNGRLGLTLSGIWTVADWEVTTGVNYTRIGDARPETGTPDTARADFEDNYAVGVGMRVTYTF